MHCSVMEHGMTSLNFQTAVQKNKGKLSSFAQFENEPSHIQSDVIACTVLR